ncbi:MAG: prenyltransferase [Spirochaetota bacterium]
MPRYAFMTIRQFFMVVEIRTKVISVSTYLLATLYSIAAGSDVDILGAGLLLVAVLCVDMGTTAFNTFYDYLRGVDNSLFTVEPDKVLLHEGVAPAHALLVSLVLYVVAAATGIAVAALSSWWILGAGAAGMLVGFLYNGGPLPISRTPLGEFFAGGFLGSILFLVIYAVHAGTVDAAAVIASLPSTLMIAAVLTVNNTCDLEGDREAGRKTLSIVLGKKPAAALVDLLVAVAYAILALSVVGRSPVQPVILLAGAAATAVTLASMHRRGYSHATKHANMSAIIRVIALYTFVYALALGVAILRL